MICSSHVTLSYSIRRTFLLNSILYFWLCSWSYTTNSFTRTRKMHCFRRAASRLLSLPVTAPTWSARALAPRVPLPVLSPLQSQLALHTRWFSDNTASQEPTSSPEHEHHGHSETVLAEPDTRNARPQKPKMRLRVLEENLRPRQTVYVGNLFYDVTAEDLKNHMQQFGVVERVDLITDNRGLSRGFAYVHFDSIEAAKSCVEAMHLQIFEGRRITAQYASSGGTRPLRPASRTLYLGNLSFEMTDRDLNELFRDINNVIDVRVSVDRRTGQPRGFAHAEFLDVESAQKAFEILSGKAPYGRRIRVDYSSTNRRGDRIEGVPDEE
ncbi:nucleic acid binding protein [Aspergillus fumigatus]|nr:nucleic acid binding protein [Aspergillus fumigatus]